MREELNAKTMAGLPWRVGYTAVYVTGLLYVPAHTMYVNRAQPHAQA